MSLNEKLKLEYKGICFKNFFEDVIEEEVVIAVRRV